MFKEIALMLLLTFVVIFTHYEDDLPWAHV
jgi:hypothetical protein